MNTNPCPCCHKTDQHTMIKENLTPPRLHFWQMESIFRCPVVGMCLSLSEQKQVLKKCGLSVKKKSAFDIHELLVASAEKAGPVSRRVDNLLNRKYRNRLDELNDREPQLFLNQFRAAFEQGDCDAATWAAATHPSLPMDKKIDIFGEIHMAMHWSGEQAITLKKKLKLKQEEVENLRESLTSENRLRRSFQKDNIHLNNKIQSLIQELDRLKKEQINPKGRPDQHVIQKLDRVTRENRERQTIIDDLMLKIKEQTHAIDRLEEELRFLNRDRESLMESNRQFIDHAQNVIGEAVNMGRCNEQCPSFDLCKKRILMVGGITKMEALYRKLIEGSGGVFDYHDGYMNKGVRQLESCLKRADLVVCPVDCNSHAACSIVKNLAKKHNKTVHMLDSSSISSVSQALRDRPERGTIN